MLSNTNDSSRQAWLKRAIAALPAGARILDAGAGELRNRVHCGHLEYVSQDFCQYAGGGAVDDGLQVASWNTSGVDIVSDIAAIPVPDASFDAVLCTEVLEHVPEPTRAIDEFSRILKGGGRLILTAPFSSNVHMAPYHFSTGFSKYWYEHHLPRRGFLIQELIPNGDWFTLLRQELTRLGYMERRCRSRSWPLGYLLGLAGVCYFRLRSPRTDSGTACFGWHCVATKR